MHPKFIPIFNRVPQTYKQILFKNTMVIYSDTTVIIKEFFNGFFFSSFSKIISKNLNTDKLKENCLSNERYFL